MASTRNQRFRPRVPFQSWLSESYIKYEIDGPVWEQDWRLVTGRVSCFPVDFVRTIQELVRLINTVKRAMTKVQIGTKAFNRYQWMYYTLMKPGGLEIAPNPAINRRLYLPRLGPFGLRMELDAIPYLSFVQFTLDSVDLEEDDEVDAALTRYAGCLAGRQTQHQRNAYIERFGAYIRGLQTQLDLRLNKLDEMGDDRACYERFARGETGELTASAREFLIKVPADLRETVARDRAIRLLGSMTAYRRNAVTLSQEKAMTEELIEAVQYLSSLGDARLNQLGQVGFSTGR